MPDSASLSATPGPARSGTNMPLLLSAICPGLGHLVYGSPVRGMFYLFITLAVFGFTLLFGIQAVMAVLGGRSFLRYLFYLGLLLLYGLFFTGRVMYEASRLGTTSGAVSVGSTEGMSRAMLAMIAGECVMIALLTSVIIQLMMN